MSFPPASSPAPLVCFGCGARHKGLWGSCKNRGKCEECGGEHLTRFHEKVMKLTKKGKAAGKGNGGSE